MTRAPVALVLVLIFAFAPYMSANVMLTQKMKQTIDEIVKRMCHGIPSLNIPQLEPFIHNDLVDISFNNSMGEVTGSVSNIHIDGISSIKVNNLQMEQFSFIFTVEIPKVSVKGKFRASGVISEMFPINGQGDFDITISSLKLHAGASVTVGSKYMEMIKLTAQPSISKLVAKIQNLVENKVVNDFMNDALNEIGPQLLQDIWADNGKMIISEFEKNQHRFLKPMTPIEFIQFGFKIPNIFENDPKPDCLPHSV